MGLITKLPISIRRAPRSTRSGPRCDHASQQHPVRDRGGRRDGRVRPRWMAGAMAHGAASDSARCCSWSLLRSSRCRRSRPKVLVASRRDDEGPSICNHQEVGVGGAKIKRIASVGLRRKVQKQTHWRESGSIAEITKRRQKHQANAGVWENRWCSTTGREARPALTRASQLSRSPGATTAPPPSLA